MVSRHFVFYFVYYVHMYGLLSEIKYLIVLNINVKNIILITVNLVKHTHTTFTFEKTRRTYRSMV